MYKPGKKFEVREKRGSVKILELDRDSSDESDIDRDESLDSLRSMEYYPCTVVPPRILLVFFAQPL